MNSFVNAQLDSRLSAAYSDAYICGMELADRLDLAMKQRGVRSQSALSRIANVPQPTINRILKGTTTKPDHDTLRKLSDALDVDLSWLASGTGAGPIPSESGLEILDGSGNVEAWDSPEDLQEDGERIWLDRYDYHFSAGNGLIQWEIRQKNALPFNAAFFKAKGSRPQDCKLLVLRGDSMEPWAEDRNLIMVDISKTKIKDGEKYAIHFQDEALVKQIFKEADGGLVLHSYNPRYPDKLVAPDKLEFVRVVGRVIYRSG